MTRRLLTALLAVAVLIATTSCRRKAPTEPKPPIPFTKTDTLWVCNGVVQHEPCTP